jgi:hypothetical protein
LLFRGLLRFAGFLRQASFFGQTGFFRGNPLLLRRGFFRRQAFCFGSFGGRNFGSRNLGRVPFGEIPPAFYTGTTGQRKDKYGAENRCYTKNSFFHVLPLYFLHPD